MRLQLMPARAERDFGSEEYNSRYDEERMKWRRALTEFDVRQLAADYLRGIDDPCLEDAYLEYQRRYIARDNPPRPKRPKTRY